jgi:hypothetical protein
MKHDDDLLSDADLDALADRLRDKVRQKFYEDLGRGVWGLLCKAFLPILAAIAAYGAARKDWF